MIEFLAKFELLQELGDDGLELLAEFVEERRLCAQDYAFRAGDEAEELLLIVDGDLRLERKGRQLGRIRAGNAVGSVSLVAIGNRECDAIAENPVLLLVLSRESYLRLRSDAPQLALGLQEAVLREFANYVREAVSLAPPS